MKNRFISAVVFMFAVIFLFSGCSLLDFFSADSLLRAPRLTGENTALQQEFEKSVGKDISLFTPISGEYRASYILKDINNDKVDEAVVFYSMNNNLSVVHMHIMENKDGIWYSLADTIGSGTSVYEVDFFNSDDENALEIAVTWMVDDSKKAKTLSVYKLTESGADSQNAITSVATVQIADYIYLDIDNDTVNEILYFYFDKSSVDESYLASRLLDYDIQSKNMLPVSDLSLNIQTTSVVQLLPCKVGNTFNIYVDALSDNGMLFTEVLMYDQEKSVLSVSQLDGSPMSVFTLRDPSLVCCDYNNDGQYDIPREIEYEGSGVADSSDNISGQIKFISWNSYRDGVLYEECKYYINFFDAYVLKIDDFYDSSYIVYDSENKETQVRSRLSENDDLIFSIRPSVSEKSGLGLIDNTDSTGTSDYVISVTPLGESMNITGAYVLDLISDKGWFF